MKWLFNGGCGFRNNQIIKSSPMYSQIPSVMSFPLNGTDFETVTINGKPWDGFEEIFSALDSS